MIKSFFKGKTCSFLVRAYTVGHFNQPDNRKQALACTLSLRRILCLRPRMRVARCIVTFLHANVIETTISYGPYKGEGILLPRIPLIPSDSELPFQFRRLQFPCKPCFSMSINKSQGQTFKAIGVDVSVPCFTHGQLYVAASRACRTSKLSIFVPNNQTRNVVYPEALQN